MELGLELVKAKIVPYLHVLVVAMTIEPEVCVMIMKTPTVQQDNKLRSESIVMEPKALQCQDMQHVQVFTNQGLIWVRDIL